MANSGIDERMVIIMQKHEYRCVIGSDGNYIEFVLMTKKGDGSVSPYAYEMKPGESLIEALPPPAEIVKPHYNGSAWVESATPQEIEAARPPQIEETSIDPLTEIRLAIAELAEIITGGV